MATAVLMVTIGLGVEIIWKKDMQWAFVLP